MRYSLFLLSFLITSSLLTENCFSCCCGDAQEEEEERNVRRPLISAPAQQPSKQSDDTGAGYQQQSVVPTDVSPLTVKMDDDDSSPADPNKKQNNIVAARTTGEFEEVSLADPSHGVENLEREKAALEEQRKRIAKIEREAQEKEERAKLNEEKQRLAALERAAQDRLEAVSKSETDGMQLILYRDVHEPGAQLVLRKQWEVVPCDNDGDLMIMLFPKIGDIYCFKDVAKAKIPSSKNPRAQFINKYHNNEKCTPANWDDLEENLQKILRIIAKYEDDSEVRASVERNIRNMLGLAKEANPNRIPITLEASESKKWARMLIMITEKEGALINIPIKEDTN